MHNQYYKQNQFNSVRALIGYDPFHVTKNHLNESSLGNLIFESSETLEAVREIGEHVKNSTIALSKLTTAFREFESSRGSNELKPLLDHFEAVRRELQSINSRARSLTSPDGFWSKLINFFSNSSKNEINKAAAVPLYVNALTEQLKNSLEQTFHTLEGATPPIAPELKLVYERQLKKFLKDNKDNIKNISKKFESDVDFNIFAISESLAKCIDNNLTAATRFKNFKQKFQKLLSRLDSIISPPAPPAPPADPASPTSDDADPSPPGSPTSGTDPGTRTGGRTSVDSGDEEWEIITRRPRIRRSIDLIDDDIITIINQYRRSGLSPLEPPTSPSGTPPTGTPTPTTSSKIKRSNLRKILTRSGITPDAADKILNKIVQSVGDQLRSQGASDSVIIEALRIGGINGLSILLAEMKIARSRKNLLRESPGPTPPGPTPPGSPKIKTANFKRFVRDESGIVDSSKIDAIINAIKQSFKDQLKNQRNTSIVVENKNQNSEGELKDLFENWNKLAGLN